ncbi:unnamed protein product [Calicophoron daubneyi]|uniref:C2H2-type domain-containing protein n=1 Tax=Calicophoron daubneyi TaxID=300641 RepID=A0AAV2T5Y4_CALDB
MARVEEQRQEQPEQYASATVSAGSVKSGNSSENLLASGQLHMPGMDNQTNTAVDTATQALICRLFPGMSSIYSQNPNKASYPEQHPLTSAESGSVEPSNRIPMSLNRSSFGIEQNLFLQTMKGSELSNLFYSSPFDPVPLLPNMPHLGPPVLGSIPSAPYLNESSTTNNPVLSTCGISVVDPSMNLASTAQLTNPSTIEHAAPINTMNQIANLLQYPHFSSATFPSFVPDLVKPRLGIPSGSVSNSQSQQPHQQSLKTDEDFCELCQKHFCNKYYLRKHKADVHGIHTEPYSHSRRRESMHSFCSTIRKGSPASPLIQAGNSTKVTPREDMGVNSVAGVSNVSLTSFTENERRESGQRFNLIPSPSKPECSNTGDNKGSPLDSQAGNSSWQSSSNVEQQMPWNSTAHSGTEGTNKPKSLIPPEGLHQVIPFPLGVTAQQSATGFPLSPYLMPDLNMKKIGGLDPVASAHYYMMALASSLPPQAAMQTFSPPTFGNLTTVKGSGDKEDHPNLSNIPFLSSMSTLENATGMREVQCDQCQKVFCNSYFLHVHKVNQHTGKHGDPEICCSTGSNASSPNNSNEGTQCNNSTYSMNTSLKLADSMLSDQNESDAGCVTENSSNPSASCESLDNSSRREHKGLGGRAPDSAVRENGSDSAPVCSTAISEARGNTTSLDAFKSSMVAAKLADRVTCELCKKELCNKYFLRTHKIRVHGVSPKDVGGPPMRNPPMVNSSRSSLTSGVIGTTESVASSSAESSRPSHYSTGTHSVNMNALHLPTSLMPLSGWTMIPPNPQTHSRISPPVTTENEAQKCDIPVPTLGRFCEQTNENYSEWSSTTHSASDPNEVFAATAIIACPLCEHAVGPRLFLPSHLNTAHALNPTDPAFFLNMLRAKVVPDLNSSEKASNANNTSEPSSMTVGQQSRRSLAPEQQLIDNTNNCVPTSNSELSQSQETSQLFTKISASATDLPTSNGTCTVTASIRNCSPCGTCLNEDRGVEGASTTSSLTLQSPLGSGVSGPVDSQAVSAPTGSSTEEPSNFVQNSPNFGAYSVALISAVQGNLSNSSTNLITSSNQMTEESRSNTLPYFPPLGLGLPSPGDTGFPRTGSIAAAAAAAAAFSGLSIHPMEAVLAAAASASSNAPWSSFPQLQHSVTASSSGHSTNSTVSANVGQSPTLSVTTGMPRKSPNQMRVLCDICNKWICNKYFLRTHKANKHGITDSSQLSSDTGKSSSVRPTVYAKVQSQPPYKHFLPAVHEHMADLNGKLNLHSGFTDQALPDMSLASCLNGPATLNKNVCIPTDSTDGESKPEMSASTTLEHFTNAWKLAYESGAKCMGDFAYGSAYSPSLNSIPATFPTSIPPAFPLPGFSQLGVMNPTGCSKTPDISSLLPKIGGQCVSENLSVITARVMPEDNDKADNTVAIERQDARFQRELQDYQRRHTIPKEQTVQETVHNKLPLNLSVKDLTTLMEHGERTKLSMLKRSTLYSKRRTKEVISVQRTATCVLRRAKDFLRNELPHPLKNKAKNIRGMTFKSRPCSSRKSEQKKSKFSELTHIRWRRSKYQGGGNPRNVLFHNERRRRICKNGFKNEARDSPLSSYENARIPNTDKSALSCPLCPNEMSTCFTNLNSLLQHIALTHGNHTSTNCSSEGTKSTGPGHNSGNTKSQCVNFQISQLANEDGRSGEQINAEARNSDSAHTMMVMRAVTTTAPTPGLADRPICDMQCQLMTAIEELGGCKTEYEIRHFRQHPPISERMVVKLGNTILTIKYQRLSLPHLDYMTIGVVQLSAGSGQVFEKVNSSEEKNLKQVLKRPREELVCLFEKFSGQHNIDPAQQDEDKKSPTLKTKLLLSE